MRPERPTRWIRNTLAAGFVLAAAAAAPAADEPGPAIGERAPAFHLADQNGEEHGLEPLLASLPEDGKLAVVFYRSADW